MDPNPLLRALGFAETDRVAIVHADDIGMCQASVAAFAELADAGLVTSGAVMMPCGWAPAAAAWARAHPATDIGVHLTLTSEWDAYRWGPLSTRDPASGLLDADGYFPRTTAAVQAADPEAATRELEAQVARALAAGIDVTHVDTHMGAVNHPRLIRPILRRRGATACRRWSSGTTKQAGARWASTPRQPPLLRRPAASWKPPACRCWTASA
jgi:predicted glycoside hydrolase/deacetylase ChbG (UPF0249 family)